MRIFYSSSAGRADVPFDNPIEVPLDFALSVLASLDTRKGFLGLVLDDRFTLQLLPNQNGARVELLDRSIPAFDSCDADMSFAENLLRVAADGQDVFAVARASSYLWTHTSLS
jgi:hypothetical protein